jgi:tRNA pseudouridine13 synthase
MAAETATLERWRRLALEPPRVLGPRPASGIVRADPSDFVVEERLGFDPDGGAAHLLLYVEKSDANTLFVARELAKRTGCAPADVGFAGLKDRRAIARQWFSVPATPGAKVLAGAEGQGFRVLSAHPHSRKLRRGALAGNRFSIRVKHVAGDAVALEERARRIGAAAVPNYFGNQRFGVGGANLERIRDWIERGWLPRGRESRAFILSAARSLCFNTVLGERVTAGTWNRILPGEVVNLAGSRSVFAVSQSDAALESRLAAGDVSPTGPMCGAEGVQPTGEAGDVERTALVQVAQVAERLAAAGLRAERRPLLLRPGGFAYAREGGELRLEFELPAGGFATAVLRELIDATVPEGVAD